MTRDPWQDPDTKAWMARTVRDLTPKIRGSAMVMSLVPDDNNPDIKFCVELGMAIMMDKPLVCVVQPGTKVPEHLIRVADEIIECNMKNEADRDKLAAAITRWTEKNLP